MASIYTPEGQAARDKRAAEGVNENDFFGQVLPWSLGMWTPPALPSQNFVRPEFPGRNGMGLTGDTGQSPLSAIDLASNRLPVTPSYGRGWGTEGQTQTARLAAANRPPWFDTRGMVMPDFAPSAYAGEMRTAGDMAGQGDIWADMLTPGGRSKVASETALAPAAPKKDGGLLGMLFGQKPGDGLLSFLLGDGKDDPNSLGSILSGKGTGVFTSSNRKAVANNPAQARAQGQKYYMGGDGWGGQAGKPSTTISGKPVRT